MEYRTYRPGPPLADLVAYMWALRDLAVHSQERIVPSGTLELVVNLNEAPDWGRLAVTYGYFDQSHLIHDVREFTGTLPSQLGPASKQVKELHLAVPAGGSSSSKTPTNQAHSV